jgi:NADH:ubiquinone oxidoreductase subunit 6 (subunit J)
MIIFFTCFSLLLFILVTPNAIHALIALISLFINFAILLFIIDSTFLGFSYILVYIGAISVLFLYIILLLHIRTYTLMQRFNTVLLLTINVIFLVVISYTKISLNFIINSNSFFDLLYLTDLELFSNYLFLTHKSYMLLGMFLLLLALFFTIFLSSRFLTGRNQNLTFITNAQ